MNRKNSLLWFSLSIYSFSCGEDNVAPQSPTVTADAAALTAPLFSLNAPSLGPKTLSTSSFEDTEMAYCVKVLELAAHNVVEQSDFSTYNEFENVLYSLSKEELTGESEIKERSLLTDAKFKALTSVISFGKKNQAFRNNLLKHQENYQKHKTIGSEERVEIYRSIVLPEALDSFNKCVSEVKGGMALKLQALNSDQPQFMIAVTYKPTDGDDRDAILADNPRLNNLVPVGSTRMKKGEKLPKYESLSLTVRREDPSLKSSIFIEFKGRPGIHREFPPIRQRRYSDSLPIGTIIESAVDNDRFMENFDDIKYAADPTKRLWVPADGRNVSGSAYTIVTGYTAVPDLRGVFIRGLNSFAPRDEKAKIADPVPELQKDPDSREFGQIQSSALQDHAHLFPEQLQAASHGGNRKEGYQSGLDGHNVGKTLGVDNANRASETRPTNFAVFRYIKINE